MSYLLKYRPGSEYAIVEVTKDIPGIYSKGDRLICYDTDAVGRAYVYCPATKEKFTLFNDEYNPIVGLRVKEVKK